MTRLVLNVVLEPAGQSYGAGEARPRLLQLFESWDISGWFVLDEPDMDRLHQDLIPLLPFVWLARAPALVLAIVLSALVLFGVGVYSAVTLVGDWRKRGINVASFRSHYGGQRLVGRCRIAI